MDGLSEDLVETGAPVLDTFPIELLLCQLHLRLLVAMTTGTGFPKLILKVRNLQLPFFMS